MRSGPGEARTIILLYINSVRPSKEPLMARTFLKVYMELGSSFSFLQEQIKDIIIIICSEVLGIFMFLCLFHTLMCFIVIQDGTLMHQVFYIGLGSKWRHISTFPLASTHLHISTQAPRSMGQHGTEG